MKDDAMAGKVRVSVDHDKCVGTTICVLTVPKVFALDKNGQAVVIDPDADTLDRLRYAEEQCPQSAITVEVAGEGNGV
jgi:ferredoxin